MLKNTRRSTSGSAHVVIIIILIVAILGALGYVFWSHFIETKPVIKTITKVSPAKTTTSISPKSKIIVLEGGDMNKYINYEYGFEFEFPKQSYTYTACQATNDTSDFQGTYYEPVIPHFTLAKGIADMTVIESDVSYIVTSNKLVSLSNPGVIGVGRYARSIFKSCDVLDTTAQLLNDAYSDTDNVDTPTETRAFDVYPTSDETAVQSLVRTLFDDAHATISLSADDSDKTRQIITVKLSADSEGHFGGGGYRFWYYPTQKKSVYAEIGQAPAFQYPDQSDNYYGLNLDSFKFSTK